MKISTVDLEKEVFVIAEIGVNHEGNFDLAKQMIEEVAETGAHAVKFQTYYASKNLYLSTSIGAERMKRTMGYEFTPEQFAELAKVAADKGLIFLSTPFDLESVDILNPLCPAFKIASGDLTFYPLLAKVAKIGKPIILSTGMGTPQEIAKALACIETNSAKSLRDSVVLLHCVTSYPCPPEAANLRSMVWMREHFNVNVGYSDHTLGTRAADIAMALGARVIEKHYTYRKEEQTFRDHQLSADKADMKEIIKNIKEVSVLLGNPEKKRNRLEEDNAITARRSLAALVV